MNLDYSLFPKIDSGYLRTPEPDKNLKEHSDLYDRFCSAIYMASCINNTSPRTILSDTAYSSCHTRAALAEFAGIDEFIEHNCNYLNLKNYKVLDQQNPLLHIMRMLRNYNIHISESTTSEKEISVYIPAAPHEIHDIKVRYIDNLSAKQLEPLHSAKKYSREDIKKMIFYFEKEQHEFGVSNLLTRGIILYSNAISRLITMR